MENTKLKYEENENYEFLKDVFLSKIKQMKGEIPEGFDNEIFLNSFIKIYNFLTKKYHNVKLSKNSIPDANRFEQREEYTISQFIFNRIVNNIEKVVVDKDLEEKATCGGRFCADKKSLEIFPKKIKEATKFEFEKYKTLNFASEEDFNKIVTEYFIIHELIHAISFDEFSIGLRNNEESVSINEGFTDSLALEISGFGEFFQYLPQRLEDNYFMLPKNSISSYTIETNISDLIRIVSDKDLTIPYLVCGERVKWANINNGFDETCYPLKKGQDVYGFFEKEIFEIANKKSTLSNKEKLTRLQNLQGCLIEDIVKNKYNKDFINKVIDNKVTKEQLEQYDKEINLIINKIVLTFPEKTAEQIFEFGAQSLEIWDIEKLKVKIDNGEIDKSPNIDHLLELLETRVELINEVNRQKENGTIQN